MKFSHTMQSDDTDCGIAVVLTILKNYHIPINNFDQIFKNVVKSFVNDNSQGLSLLELSKILSEYKLPNNCFKVTDYNEMFRVQLPCIVRTIKDGIPHYIVVHKITEDNMIISNPDNSDISKISLDEFKKVFSGYAIIISPPAKAFNKHHILKKNSYKSYLDTVIETAVKSISIHSKLMLILSAIGVFFIPILLTESLSYLLDTAIENLNMTTLMILVLVSVILIFLFNQSLHRITNSKITLVNSIQRKVVMNFLKNKTNDIYASKDVDSSSAYFWNIIVAVQGTVDKFFLKIDAIYVIFLLFITCLYSYPIAIVLIIWFIILVILLHFQINNICAKFEKNMSLSNNYASSFIQIIQTSFDINAFNKLKPAFFWFQKQMNSFFSSTYEYADVQIKLQTTIQAIITCMMLSLTGIYMFLFKINAITFIESIDSSIYILFIITSGASGIIGDFVSYTQSKRAMEYINVNNQISDVTDSPISVSKDKDQYITQIEIKDLIYKSAGSKKIIRYPNHIFTNKKLNLLTGNNGSGKSTLIKILSGLEKSYFGKIFVNNNSNKYKAIDFTKLQTMCSLYTHEMEVYSQNVKNNILYNVFEVTSQLTTDDQQKYETLRATLRLDIDDQFLVTSKGTNISQGQKQKILILRTLMNPAKIYFFDEPTTSLDQKSKKALIKILQILVKHEKLVIVISHDPIFNDIDKEILNLE